MKNSYELYRVHPNKWENLPYKEAINMKIKSARQAMDYYRLKLDEERYIASEKAMNFNRKLLEELTQ